MSFILNFFKGKKKDPRETIDEFLNRVYDAKYTVDMHFKSTERKIKKYFESNQMPPPILLMSWKSLVAMRKTINGMVETAKSAMTFLDINQPMSDVTRLMNDKEFQGILGSIQNGWKDLQNQLTQMINMQRRFLMSTDRFTQLLSGKIEQLEDITSDYQDEAMEQFGQELIEMMRVESPELYEMMPDELKSKLDEKSIE